MQYFTSRDGLRLAYQVHDFTDPWRTPETLVLLHAANGSARRWFQWVPILAREFRVITPELRGHGHSQIPAPDSEFSLDLLVGDVLQLLDLLEVPTAHIVGNSAGGYIAQKLAIHHPDRVHSLSLFAATPGLKNSQANTWPEIIRRLGGVGKFMASTIHERFDPDADPRLVNWFIEQCDTNDPEFFCRFAGHMATHYFMDEVDRIQCPTLIVGPSREPIGHSSAYEEMHQRIAGSELILYETASHNICDGYAARCAQEVRDYLRRSASPAARTGA